MLQSPIFHVNGEDPEAVAQCVQLAIDFRREFKRDVVIDMYCYRRRGHNEADEPTFTQPLWYKAIERHEERPRRVPRIPAEDGRHLARRSRRHRRPSPRATGTRSERRPQPRIQAAPRSVDRHLGRATAAVPKAKPKNSNTGVAKDELVVVSRKPRDGAGRLQRPSEAAAVPRRAAKRWPRGRSRSIGRPAKRWPTPRLAVDGYRIRMTGQDSERGTFSHRHAVLHDYENGRRYMALRHLLAVASAGRNLQQPAVGNGRARLRIRLQPRLAAGPGHLGSAVRRLRQRRAEQFMAMFFFVSATSTYCLLIVVECRGSHAEQAGYVDKKFGNVIDYIGAIHLVRNAPGTATSIASMITQRFPEQVASVEQAQRRLICAKGER